MTYRIGNHQPQNLYRDDQYIGVMFDPADTAKIAALLNADEPCRDRVTGLHFDPCTCPTAADSCTCPLPLAADPYCPVHDGRRARGPKPPPVGPGCICDGSGRTCPRHGAVI